MTVSICIGSIVDTLNKLRPFFQQFPLDRIEVDLFPEGTPEFYFAFNLNTSDADCEYFLEQLHSARLDITLALQNTERLTETLYARSQDLMKLFYPTGHSWSLCTLTYAPIADLYQEIKDTDHLPAQYETSDEMGFKMAMEIPLLESSNEVEVETFYGTASLLVDDFSLKNGTLH
jgi:hypothetical protein